MKARKSARRGKARGPRDGGSARKRPAPPGCGKLPAGGLFRQPCPGAGNVRHTLRRRPGRETRPPGSRAWGKRPSSCLPAQVPQREGGSGKGPSRTGRGNAGGTCRGSSPPPQEGKARAGEQGVHAFPPPSPAKDLRSGENQAPRGKARPGRPGDGGKRPGAARRAPLPCASLPRHRAAGATQCTESTRPRSSRRKARPWRPCGPSPCPSSPSCRWW